MVIPLPGLIPLPSLPVPGTALPPIIIIPNNPLNNVQENPLDSPDINMGDTETWPVPPGDGPFIEGDPSRKKAKERGEKSLYDKNGGEWRPHSGDLFHPEGHWDYKPPATKQNKFPAWKNIDIPKDPVPLYPMA
jgi:hypothetical protein